MNAKTLSTIIKGAGKINSAVLTAMLVICFALPGVGFSQRRAGWVQSVEGGQLAASTEQTNGQTAQTCPTAQAKQIIYSGDARAASVSVAFGATWGAAFQTIEILLGQLNANVKVEMYCEEIKTSG